MFEFSVAFAFSMIGGYSFLSAALPDPLDRVHPDRRRARAAAVRLEPAVRDRAARAGPPERAAADDPRRHGGHCRTASSRRSSPPASAYLIQGQDDRFAWLPSHKVLDEVAYRAVIIGFPIFATMIILGSWWASIAWSRYWGWDPKETAALVTWLTYAVYLHARNQRSWAGRPGRAAARRRVRDGPRHVLGLALVQRPARLLRPLKVGRRAAGVAVVAIALAFLTAGCQYLFGFPPVAVPPPGDEFAMPSPLATFASGHATIAIGKDAPIRLDELAAPGACTSPWAPR